MALTCHLTWSNHVNVKYFYHWQQSSSQNILNNPKYCWCLHSSCSSAPPAVFPSRSQSTWWSQEHLKYSLQSNNVVLVGVDITLSSSLKVIAALGEATEFLILSGHLLVTVWLNQAPLKALFGEGLLTVLLACWVEQTLKVLGAL